MEDETKLTDAAIEQIRTLKEEIRKQYGCNSAHIISVPVFELFQDKIVWVVEVFKIFNHPESEWAYGWVFKNSEQTQHIVILGIHPVENAITAVKEWFTHAHF